MRDDLKPIRHDAFEQFAHGVGMRGMHVRDRLARPFADVCWRAELNAGDRVSQRRLADVFPADQTNQIKRRRRSSVRDRKCRRRIRQHGRQIGAGQPGGVVDEGFKGVGGHVRCRLMLKIATRATNSLRSASVNYEDRYRVGGTAALMEAERFLMGESEVQKTLKRITEKLDELQIPYAVVGGMALVAHGYNRTTIDVDLLVTADSLKAIHQALDGLGYLPPFAGSKQLRDTTTNVRVEFLVAGQFPGDGKPKPVAFPDPKDVSVRVNGISYISLPAIIELKLASGSATPPGRKTSVT